MDLHKILDNFNVKGTIHHIKEFGSGHINSTFKVKTAEQCFPNYILQRINHQVFQNVPELSENIQRITKHIKSKLENQYPAHEVETRVLSVIMTHSNNGYHKDESGNYWRLYKFIENSNTFDFLQSTTQAESLGRTFGEFHGSLCDFPSPNLFETIPDFHNVAYRIKQLNKSIRQNSHGRLHEVKKEVSYLLQFEDEMKKILRLGKSGVLPPRIVHQDTKLSNVLFDSNGEVLCVIDLDTTMHGYLCYDFGDAVRGGMNTGKEDDENLDNVSVDMDLFKAFAQGYAESTKKIITQAEIKSLCFGVKLLIYEQAVRFLNDYLDNDQYYRTHKEKHNLLRARAQIALFKDVLLQYEEMEQFVLSLYLKQN